MLNVSPFGVEAAVVDYYLARAAGCRHEGHDPKQDVIDYYAGRREAGGEWVGAGAARLGMVGPVEARQFRELLLEGRTPDGVQRVGPQLRRNEAGDLVDRRVAGVDLTFRAPKSVSLIFAFGDGLAVDAVRASHEHAAREALRYLEGVGSYSRRGKAGMGERVAGHGFLAASFRHRDARPVAGEDHGDPLLHTHLVVANMLQAADGRWGALPTVELFRHSKTAGYLYQAVLRAQLTERLGVGWTPVRNGYADVAGVPRPVVEHFSRRRGEITAEMQRRGDDGATAAQAATLATRGAKATDADADEPTLRERWATRGEAVGYGAEQVAQLLLEAAHRSHGGASLTDSAALLGAEGLTRRSSTFARRDVLRALAENAAEGASLDVLQAAAGRLLDGPEVVPLGDDIDLRYTTREMLAVEQHVMDMGGAGRGAGLATVPDRMVAAAAAAVPFELGEDQAAMVRGLLTSGNAVEVVQASAGTGKTTALSAARLGWEAAGHRVLGSSTAARAARELADGGGIEESSTLARLLGDLEHADHGGFAPNTVLVVDEAGMVGSRVLERVLAVAERDRAKVVLVGDSKQLPEIDAGGAFHGLAERLGAHQLTTNRRQENGWEREALTLLRAGQAGAALDRYVEHGRVTVADTTAGARASMVADWWDATERQAGDVRREPAQPAAAPVMIAARRVDVQDLNGLGRTLMQRTGRLTGETLTADGKDFQAGDRVVTLKNDRRIGVHNGSRGTVSEVHDGALAVRLDSGEDVTLPARYVAAGRVDHGYAITGHKGQGMTTERAFVLGIREALYAEWGYVAMSRAKVETRLYLVTGASTEIDHDMPQGQLQDAAEWARWALAQSKAQTMALDAGPVRSAGTGELEALLSESTQLLRTRPSAIRDGADKTQAWTAEHEPELTAAVAAGDELAWRGKAERVATEADPATREAVTDRGRGPVRRR